jgi:hypothetical protein
MLTLMDEALTIDPLATIAPTDGSYDGKGDGADTSSDRKSLGPR